MHRIMAVLQRIEEVAAAHVGTDGEDALLLEVWPLREGGRLALTQVGEDQAEVFPGRVAGDLHLGREGGVFRRHLDALPCPVVLPAVVEAADAVPLHPPVTELRPPVRAAKPDYVGRSPFPAVEGKVLAHHADWLRVPGRQVGGQPYGLPEGPQVASG